MSNHPLFETFDLSEIIEELKSLLKNKDFSDFDNKHIVIAVPLFDEGMHNIKKYDKELFSAQLNDAQQLQKFLTKNTNAKIVDVVVEAYEAHKIIDRYCSVDDLILLHEFMPVEQDYLTTVLKKDTIPGLNTDLNVYTLA